MYFLKSFFIYKKDRSNVKLILIVWEKGHAGEGGGIPLEREKIKLSFS